MIPISEEFANGFAALIEDQEWMKVAVISSIDNLTKKVGDNIYTINSWKDVCLHMFFLYTVTL